MEAVAAEFDWMPEDTVIIHGGCNVPDGAYTNPRWKPVGADALAHHCAAEKGFEVHMYRADWKLLGRKAGPMRNQAMLDHGKPDLVLAFPGSRGTADMVRRATAAGVPVKQCLAISVRTRDVARA